MSSLNPCFSGGWSRRPIKVKPTFLYKIVLILVLVEDGLGASYIRGKITPEGVS